jgi:phosphate-selective porin OprO and OprP
VIRRFHFAVFAAVWLLASTRAVLLHAQSLDPTAAAPASAAPSSNNGVQALEIRLQQQDEELRQLRDQLGMLQNQVHALPPVTQTAAQSELQPLPPPETVPTSTMADYSDLQTRMTAMEKRLDEQAAAISAGDKKSSDGASDGYVVGSDLTFSGTTWAKGLQIQTANKDFRMHVGGVLQFDMNYFDNPPGIQNPASVGGIGPQPDSFDFRRIRLRLDGTFYEVFDFFVQVDFANMVTPAGSPNVQSPATTSPAFDEMYINWGYLPYVGNFRVGNIKEPMGFEHMQTDSQLPFMERSYLQDFVFGPFNGGYSPGMELLDWREDLKGTWAVGFFGADDDQFGFSLGNDYAVTSRLTWCPYFDEPSDGAYMVHFGVAGSDRAADEGIVRFRDRGDIRSGPPGILNPIYVDTNYSGKITATTQDVAATEFALVMNSFSVVAEWAGTWVEDAAVNGTKAGTPFFQGGYIQCENAFWVHDANGHCCHGWGAWQILARYNAVDLNDNGIVGGELNSFTLGVNWFWNPQAHVQFNYDFTDRSAIKTTPRADINMVGMRFTYDF